MRRLKGIYSLWSENLSIHCYKPETHDTVLKVVVMFYHQSCWLLFILKLHWYLYILSFTSESQVLICMISVLTGMWFNDPLQNLPQSLLGSLSQFHLQFSYFLLSFPHDFLFLILAPQRLWANGNWPTLTFLNLPILTK